MQSVATGLAIFIASLLGGWVANALRDVRIMVLGLTIVNFQLLFAFSSLCRIALLPLALRLKEDKAQSVGTLLNLVGDKVSQRFSEGLTSGIMAIRKVRRNNK